jgi:hypothetical protein
MRGNRPQEKDALDCRGDPRLVEGCGKALPRVSANVANHVGEIHGYHVLGSLTRNHNKNELISKAEAEKMLKRLIKSNEGGGIANEVAAALLALVLKDVSAFQSATRQ